MHIIPYVKSTDCGNSAVRLTNRARQPRQRSFAVTGAILVAAGAAAVGVTIRVVADHNRDHGAPVANAASGLPPARSGPVLPALHVSAGRYTQLVAFDNGALVARPTGTTPTVSAPAAIAAFRATAMPRTVVSHVTVALADVTFRSGVMAGRSGAYSLPAAWVITFTQVPTFDCPLARSPSVTAGPLPDTVFVISGQLGISYTGSGATCGPSKPAHAVIADEYLSVPWTTAKVDGHAATISYDTDSCATATSVNADATTERTLSVLIAASIPMARRQCRGAPATQAQVLLGSHQTLAHAPTGLVIGIFTTDRGFSYATDA